MQTITLTARYDGQHIQLDEPHNLEPGTPLMVTVLPKPSAERDDWHRFAAQGLAAAYGNEEPEYGITDLTEINPAYDGG